eukprot:gene14627-16783_t
MAESNKKNRAVEIGETLAEGPKSNAFATHASNLGSDASVVNYDGDWAEDGDDKDAEGGFKSQTPTTRVEPMVFTDDKSLLEALHDVGEAFCKAVDEEPGKITLNAFSEAMEIDFPPAVRTFARIPDATIYMVSNRAEYSSENPSGVGVREVKVKIANRTIQIEKDELGGVPRGKPDENVLLFLHGFNNSATDAALAAWKLGNKLPGIDKTVFFSWPSRNFSLSYWADFKIATASVPYVVQCIKELASSRPGKVHIGAHSMGCRLLTMALINYLNTEGVVKLGQVYFIAADVDQTVFLPAMARIGESNITTNLSNIASGYDYALFASASLFVNGKSRAGLYMPLVYSLDSPPPFMSLLRTYPGHGNSHSYFNDANVRADISNQVMLYHTDAAPANIRLSYKPQNDAQNALNLTE